MVNVLLVLFCKFLVCCPEIQQTPCDELKTIFQQEGSSQASHRDQQAVHKDQEELGKIAT